MQILITIIEWIATIVTLCGAVLTSMDIDPWNIYILNICTFLWIIWGFITKNKSIAIVNAGMLFIYIFGIFVRNPEFQSWLNI